MRTLLLPVAVAVALLATGCAASAPSAPSASNTVADGWGGSEAGLSTLAIPAFSADAAAHVVLKGGQLTNVQGDVATSSGFTMTAACAGAKNTSAVYWLLLGADTNPVATTFAPAQIETIRCDGKAHKVSVQSALSGPVKLDLRQLVGGRVGTFYAELDPS